jgi:microcystin-dependent protein
MELYIGTIIQVAQDWAPIHTVLCEGQRLSVNRYTELFNMLGTKYGGDGITDFGIPDLRPSPEGWGNSVRTAMVLLGPVPQVTQLNP